MQSVRPQRPSRSVPRAGVRKRRRLFHVGSRPSSASLSKPLPQDRNGSMRSNSTVSACPRASSEGGVQLLTRTGLDWSDKYPSVVEALAKVRAKSAYLDGELVRHWRRRSAELFADTGRKRWLTRGSSRLFRFRPALVLKSTASQDLGRKAIVKGLLRNAGGKVRPAPTWSVYLFLRNIDARLPVVAA